MSAGAPPASFGRRNAPSASYAVFAPRFTTKGGARGGQFWDGRAATLTEQAKGPFLNPVEMANTSRPQVIAKIAQSPYAQLFRTVCGTTAFSPSKVDAAYNCMATAFAAFEGTTAFRPFTSKFDAVKAGRASFATEERLGETLFNDRGNLDVAESLRPEAVVLDIGMRGMDGYEVCERLRAARCGKSITIVAVTGWGQPEDRRRSEAAGFDLHLVKPLDPRLLLTRIAELRSAAAGSPHVPVP